jgi:dihydroorotate dehydrogenase electron transfer subunit
MTAREHRGTIFVEDGVVRAHQEFRARQYVITLHAPRCAAAAVPGSFVHLSCDADLPMRRPLSIMLADAAAGTIDILYKVVGQGLELLSRQPVGASLSVMGPIGHGFTLSPARPRPLLIGGGVGIPPMIFLADLLRRGTDQRWRPLVMMGSEVPFPFRARPSTLVLPGMPPGVIACMPLLEDWGIASRLASLAGFPGCYEGYVTSLADTWLETLTAEARAEVAIYACGPTPMLKAVAGIAQRFGIPAQVSLEEFMACAVGGCAGCAVPVLVEGELTMKRVCVDGPVFDADAVFPPRRS